MLVYVGIKTYMILKLLRNPKMKTYIEMLANVGIKIYISLKSAVSAVLKEFSKTLNKKTYISKRSFKRGDSTSLPCCSDFTPSLYIFFRAKVKLLENVGIKFCISKNVGKCEYKTYI